MNNLHPIRRDSALLECGVASAEWRVRSAEQKTLFIPHSALRVPHSYAGTRTANTFPSTAVAQAMRHWSWRMAASSWSRCT